METPPRALERREQLALTLFRLADGPAARTATELPSAVAQGWLAAADHALEMETAASQSASEDLDQARRSRQFTESWYGERFERLKAYAKEHGFWHDLASIIANGTLGPRAADGSFVYEVPTYAQQLNMAIWRAERAEAQLMRLARYSSSVFRHAHDCKLVSGELCSCGLIELRGLLEELAKSDFSRRDNPVPPGFGRGPEKPSEDEEPNA
jgi:hypothetical protein